MNILHRRTRKRKITRHCVSEAVPAFSMPVEQSVAGTDGIMFSYSQVWKNSAFFIDQKEYLDNAATASFKRWGPPSETCNLSYVLNALENWKTVSFPGYPVFDDAKSCINCLYFQLERYADEGDFDLEGYIQKIRTWHRRAINNA